MFNSEKILVSNLMDFISINNSYFIYFISLMFHTVLVVFKQKPKKIIVKNYKSWESDLHLKAKPPELLALQSCRHFGTVAGNRYRSNEGAWWFGKRVSKSNHVRDCSVVKRRLWWACATQNKTEPNRKLNGFQGKRVIAQHHRDSHRQCFWIGFLFIIDVDVVLSMDFDEFFPVWSVFNRFRQRHDSVRAVVFSQFWRHFSEQLQSR